MGTITNPEAQSADDAIVVFHDESGDFGHDDWVVLGLLWVRQDDVAELAAELGARREADTGEIHFYRFPRNFGGAFGAAARTARAWFDLWRDEWGRRVWFNALAINRRHARYDGVRIGRPEQAYNAFTAMALRAGLAAFFRGVPSLALAIRSDARSGRAAGLAAPTERDAFAAALRQALAPDGATGGMPVVTLDEAGVRMVDGQRVGDAFTPEQDLLQLTDLLLGAVGTAIEPRATAATKRHFAREIARAMREVRVAPRPDALGLHGRFLVHYFPGPDGRLTTEGPIGVLAE